MTQPLSHKFISEIETSRNRLYAAVLGKTGGSAASVEQILQTAARSLFSQFAKDVVVDVPAGMAQSLGITIPDAVETSVTPMPADVWARLAAAVQVEAAASSNAKALNPDSVLLRPDPILAPRKKSTAKDDPESFDLSSPSRILVTAAIIVLIGLVITLYIVTRPARSLALTTQTGAMQPTTAPATAPVIPREMP